MSPLDPRDDGVHRPDPARERWRESWYFKWWDFGQALGGDTTIGYRPARGHSGALNVLWGDGLPTLVAAELDHAPDHTRPHPVAGLTYEQEEPFGAWRIRFDGHLNDGGALAACDPAAVVPAGDSAGVATVPVAYDLRFAPDRPAYRYRDDPQWDGLFDGHVNEVGRVTGTVTIDGVTRAIDGRGCKDHSWGVRDWARPHGWRWVDMLFGDGGPELSLWRATFDGERWRQDGAIYAGSGAAVVAEPIVAFEESVSWADRPGAPRPARWEFAAASASHRLAGSAEIVCAVPLVYPIRDEHGRRTTAWIDRCRYRAVLEDGREAVGTVEFQRRV